MRVSVFILALSVICLATPAVAQGPLPEEPIPAQRTISLTEVPPTPEMWFYQEAIRRYNDPQVAVREKAAFVSRQRQNRIAARKWYGISLARPQATPTPTTTATGNVWGGGIHAIAPYNTNIATPRITINETTIE